MLDKLERVRHGFLYNSEGAGERVFVELKAALQFRIIFDSGISSESFLGYRGIFPGELLCFSHHAQEVDCDTAVLAILQPRLSGSNDSRRKQTIFGVRRSKE